MVYCVCVCVRARARLSKSHAVGDAKKKQIADR